MPKTILVVDDEEDCRNIVKAILQRNGFAVSIAINGDDCLRKIAEQKVDLILLDIMMPGTPVKELIKKIRDIKIAYLSVVKVSDVQREHLLEPENIADFIQKPFDVQDLVKRVSRILLEKKADIKKQILENKKSLVLVSAGHYDSLVMNIAKQLSEKRVGYITLNKTFSSLFESFKLYGIQVKNFIFVDTISNSMWPTPNTPQCFFINGPSNLRKLSETISTLFKQGYEIIIFDALTDLARYNTKSEVKKFISELLNKIENTQTKTIFYALNNKENKLLIKYAGKHVNSVITL